MSIGLPVLLEQVEEATARCEDVKGPRETLPEQTGTGTAGHSSFQHGIAFVPRIALLSVAIKR